MTEQNILHEQHASNISSTEQAELCSKRTPLLLLFRFRNSPFVTENHVWEAVERSSKNVLKELQKPGMTQLKAVALLLATHPKRTKNLYLGSEILAASQKIVTQSI